jgi:hypothetical protein
MHKVHLKNREGDNKYEDGLCTKHVTGMGGLERDNFNIKFRCYLYTRRGEILTPTEVSDGGCHSHTDIWGHLILR